MVVEHFISSINDQFFFSVQNNSFRDNLTIVSLNIQLFISEYKMMLVKYLSMITLSRQEMVKGSKITHGG